MATLRSPEVIALRRRLCRALVLGAGMILAACATDGIDPDTTSAGLRADRNGDRNVSCEEWRSWLGDTFDASDGDGSGQLSGREYETFVVETGLFQKIPLTKIDTNSDRQYSAEEIAAAGKDVFEKGDRNGDCVLSRRELNAPDLPEPKPEKTPPAAGPNVPDSGSCRPPLCRETTN